jgi:uncharacterized protein (TIGR00730 family)
MAGEEIARRGWTLIWGGENASMMGAVAQGARLRGGRTLGVITNSLMHRADLECEELITVDSLQQRKAEMVIRSDALLVLPGGLGTCDELFDSWISHVVDTTKRPIVLLDFDDHFLGLIGWLEGLRDSGFISTSALERATIATTLEEALAACETRAENLEAGAR